jgi:prepilin-type N-terminal cleavage/methylation domain-containing protein
MMDMRRTAYTKGFTLVELMVALIVMGIIMGAIATLAFAFGTANDMSDDTDRKQAQIRFATLRVSELIRHCKLICLASPDDFAVWRADDNEDGQINFSELVYIEKGADSDHLHFCEFSISVWDPAINLSDIQTYSTNWWVMFNMNVESMALIPECGNVQFQFDASPPQSKFVNISFEITENDIVREYHIDSALRCWAGHLLNIDGTDLISDDD